MMAQRILAVDDEPSMLKLLERIIAEKTAYEIATTSNSLEVPAILEDKTFDLIITDLKMPGLDGLDLLRLVKEKNRDEELIVITAFGSLETAIEGLSLGVFDYITKPFKREQIIHAVDRAMRWQGLKKAAKRAAAVFDLEPFEVARHAFEVEYILRLAERCNRDPQAIAARSGLPNEVIAAALERGDEDADQPAIRTG
jgi:DNA-binding NtrC family response regulator